MEFRDLKTQYQVYKGKLDDAIQNVLASGTYIGGLEVALLERRLADYVGVKHCITCANGTEAMSLVLIAWGIKAGDAVFVPDFTFFATGEVVSHVGATPVFVDVDRKTFNIDPEQLEKNIQKILEEGKDIPRVIIPVDLFGLPANHLEINRIAKKYNLLILEDGAQGFGGSIDDNRACSFGDVATTSFFPAKPLGCYGDGGAIFTDDDDLAELLRSLKVHGKGSDKYDNVRIGVNSRLDTIQAAILNVKLTAFIAHELADVQRVYRWYTGRLNEIVEIPFIPERYTSSFAQYTIKLQNRKERDELQSELKASGIPTMVYYKKPMHEQAAFASMIHIKENFQVTNELCDTVLSLPMHPYLKESEVEEVCRHIEAYLEES